MVKKTRQERYRNLTKFTDLGMNWMAIADDEEEDCPLTAGLILLSGVTLRKNDRIIIEVSQTSRIQEL